MNYTCGCLCNNLVSTGCIRALGAGGMQDMVVNGVVADGVVVSLHVVL